MIAPRIAALRAVVIVGLASLALAVGCGVASTSALATDPVDRVLVVTLPGVGWADVQGRHLPYLERFVESAAVGDISTRIRLADAGSTDAYLTLGAGTRALAPRIDTAVAVDPDERYRGLFSAQILERRLGHVPSGIAYLAMGAATQINESSSFGATVGTLGDALARAGVGRAVIANADAGEGFVSSDPPPEGAYSRGAAAMLVDSDGIVPGGTVSRNLLMDDPEAPFGLRLDHERVLEEFDAVWTSASDDRVGTRRVVLVEASDLSRAQAYRPRATPTQREDMWAEALARSDALLGALLERVDPERDAVLVLSPVSSSATPGLGLVAADAPETEAELLRSATTRRDGYVQLADVAPTVLSLVGVSPPEAVEGRSFEVAGTELENRVASLVDSAAAAGFRDALLSWFIATVCIVLLALLVAGWSRHRLGERTRRAVSWVAFAVLGVVPATFLVGQIGRARSDWTGYLIGLAVIASVVATTAWWAERRRRGAGLVLAMGVIVGLIAVDVLLGAPLQVNTVFGYSMAIAGRFVGLGNFAFAVFGAAAIVLASLIVERGGRPALPYAAALLGVVVLVEGLPMLGADVGGTISMIPAFGLTILLLARRRVGWRETAVLAGLTVVVLVVFTLIDAARPAGSHTHLFRFGENILDGRWGLVLTTLGRRWQASLGDAELTGWAVVAMLMLAAGVYVALVAHGRAGPGVVISDDRRPAAAAGIGLVVLSILGVVANDSSFAVPATMLVVVVPVLVVRSLTGGGPPYTRRVPLDPVRSSTDAVT